MTQPAPCAATPARLVLRLCRHLLALGRGRVAGAVGLNAVAGLLEGGGMLMLPSVLRLAGLGDAAGGGGVPLAALGYVALTLAVAGLLWARAASVHGLSLDLLDVLRRDLHAAVLDMEWGRFRDMRSAALLQAMTAEVNGLSYAVTLLGGLVGVLFTMPFVFAASLVLSWQMTLSALVLVLCVLPLMRRLGREGFRLGREMLAVSRSVQAELADDLAGFRIVKGFGAEEVRSQGVIRRFAAARDNLRRFQRIQSGERAVLQAVAALAAAAALYVAVSVLRLPVAEALVLILAYGRLLQTALRGLGLWRQLTGAVAALDGYERTLSECRAAAEPFGGAVVPVPRRMIRLRGVSFLHSGGGGVTDISTDLPVGQVIAVIGPSGCGKSTLMDVLSGLVAPDQGDILLDDFVLNAGARRGWRHHVAAVPQDPFLFHDTIAANLRLALPGADDEALWRALEGAAIADFVRGLPDGLDTIVGDRGARLSGGERQRIVLARALLRRPALLVLDEATASLDASAEASVTQAVARLRGACTVVVVAHRPETLRLADHVLLLDGGMLLDAGTWPVLRRRQGDRLAQLGMAGAE